MKNLIVLLLVLFSGSTKAGSWYFFAPSIGYYQGHYNTQKLSGIGLNFKLGFNWDKLFVGGDVDYAQGLNASDVTWDLDVQNTGLVLGYNGGAYRLWYTLISGATNSYKSGASEVSATGDGYKLGVGAKMGGNSYLNLEASFLDYSEQSTDGTVSDVDQFMDLILLSYSVWI